MLRPSSVVGPLFVLLIAGVSSLACVTPCPAIPPDEKGRFLEARPEEGGYVINPQDQLQVEVWQKEELTRSVRVRPDGRITLPLVNDIQAAGDTVPQFQVRLTEALRQFIKAPIVSITVTNFSQKRIFIQGQVENSAAYNYSGELHLLQALTLAGGVTPFADRCAVVVRYKGTDPVRYDVDLEPILNGQDLKHNILLQPNDVLTVH